MGQVNKVIYEVDTFRTSRSKIWDDNALVHDDDGRATMRSFYKYFLGLLPPDHERRGWDQRFI